MRSLTGWSQLKRLERARRNALGLELRLDAVVRELVGRGHDASVGDDAVEALRLVLERGRRLLRRLDAHQVELDEFLKRQRRSSRTITHDLVAVGTELLDRIVDLGLGARGHVDGRTGPDERARRLETDACVPARHDEDLAVLRGDVLGLVRLVCEATKAATVSGASRLQTNTSLITGTGMASVGKEVVNTAVAGSA